MNTKKLVMASPPRTRLGLILFAVAGSLGTAACERTEPGVGEANVVQAPAPEKVEAQADRLEAEADALEAAADADAANAGSGDALVPAGGDTGERLVTAAEIEERNAVLASCLAINKSYRQRSGVPAMFFHRSAFTLAQFAEKWGDGSWEYAHSSGQWLYRTTWRDEVTERSGDLVFQFKIDPRSGGADCPSGFAYLVGGARDGTYVDDQDVALLFKLVMRNLGA